MSDEYFISDVRKKEMEEESKKFEAEIRFYADIDDEQWVKKLDNKIMSQYKGHVEETKEYNLTVLLAKAIERVEELEQNLREERAKYERRRARGKPKHGRGKGKKTR